MSGRLECPDCHASKGLAEYDDHTYCFACKETHKYGSLVIGNKKNPEIFGNNESPLPRYAIEFLSKFYITDEHINKFEVCWNDKSHRILFPYKVAGNTLCCFARSIRSRYNDVFPEPKWIFNGIAGNVYYIKKNVHGTLYDRLVIVEDVISAIRVSDICDVVALGGTNIYNSMLQYLIRKYVRITLFLDGDEAGQKATKQFIHTYNLSCKIDVIETKQDPKCYSKDELERIISG